MASADHPHRSVGDPPPVRADDASLKATLRAAVGPEKADRWFGHQVAFDISSDGVHLRAATPYLMKHVLRTFRDEILAAAGRKGTNGFALSGGVDETLAAKKTATAQRTPEPTASVDEEDRDTSRTLFDLDEFVVGACNELGHSAVRHFIHEPGLAFGPLMIVGPVGVGKTHLLRGLAAELRRAGRYRVMCLSAVDFCNRFKQAMAEHNTAGFRNRFRSVGVLCIDDVDFFNGTRAFQAELLQTIERMEERGVRFVMTSGKNPQTLTNLSDELISRLSSGIVCRVEKPSQPVRRRVAAAYSRRLNADLSAEAIRYAADRSADSVRQVLGAVHTLAAEGRMAGKKLGVSHARTTLARLNEGRVRVVSLSSIEAAVGGLFGVTSTELRSSSRARRISRPRHFAMCVARRLTSSAYHEIGAHFGGRNHSTVVAAEKTVAKLIDNGDPIRVGCHDLTADEVLRRLEETLRAG